MAVVRVSAAAIGSAALRPARAAHTVTVVRSPPSDATVGKVPRFEGWLRTHLASRDVARVLYGSIIGMALVVALQAHPPTAGIAVAALVGTAVAVGLAELYSEFVSAEARERRPVARAETRTMAGEAVAVVFGAGFPAVFFVLAAADLIDMGTAFALSKWTGLGLICGYGFLAARLTGAPVSRAVLHAGAVGLIGVGLIGLKAFLH
jgi:hypothetical protein